MLKIDKKYSEKFLPGLKVKSEMISPYKGFRLYSYEQNRFMCIETELGKGIVKEHMLDPFKDKLMYETHIIGKHTIYVGRACK